MLTFKLLNFSFATMTSSNNLSVFAPDELVALARHHIDSNRLDLALEKLKLVLAGNAPEPEAIAMTARLYAQLGLPRRAQELFQHYLALHPDAPTEQFQLAMAYFNDGQAEQAQVLWDAILERDPVHPPALYFSALHQARQGKAQDARRHLDVLLQSAASSNLYAERGRELLQSLDSATQQ
jgi:tetratricopeptide (TPR) repeat protein